MYKFLSLLFLGLVQNPENSTLQETDPDQTREMVTDVEEEKKKEKEEVGR